MEIPVYIRFGTGEETEVGTISSPAELDSLLRGVAAEYKNHLRAQHAAPRNRAGRASQNRETSA